MSLALVTIVAGRHDHLARQLDGVARSTRPPDDHVVVAMEPREAPALRALCGDRAHVVAAPASPDGLNLARARNVGAREAMARGAGVLVLLDVDCIPASTLLSRYQDAADAHPSALLCGPVAYLPPGRHPLDTLAAAARPHPDRPAPPDGAIVCGGDHRLFWSLSFAVRAATWRRIAGFHEQYRGYGAEDTDFGQLARARGIDLCWVGGAASYHQHHPTSDPPVEHLDDILRNARTYHRRWGTWPMEGWLQAFAQAGLAAYDPSEGWTRAGP
jgi:GT2 family glycosyltransferase